MALSEFNKSIEGVDYIILKSSYAMNEFGQSALTGTSILNELKADARALQEREQALLAKFGGLDGLKSRIAKFKADASRFAGRSLGANLTFAYEAANKAEIAKAQQEFEYYIVQSMQDFLPQVARDTLTTEDLFRYLNLKDLGLSSMEVVVTERGSTITKGQRISGGQVGSKKQANIPLSEFILHKASAGVKARIAQAVDKIKKEYGIVVDTDINIQSNQIRIGEKWRTETQGLNETDAKNNKFIRDNLGDINRRIAEEIENMLGLKQYSSIFWRVMGQMLSQNPYMFFVGNNIHQLTGLIGEITAMILFYDLIGEFPSVEWAAQNTGLSGTQASADIIIEAGFGIQVKNSTSDFGMIENEAQSLTIGFSDVSFDRLGEIMGFNAEAIQDLYDAKTYNVAYEWGHGSGSFFQGDNDRFMSYINAMNALIDNFESLMTMYSASLLYMEDARNKNMNVYSGDIGNVLYMVSLVPYLASDMLQKIIDALEGNGANPLSFSVSGYKDEVNSTIVEDINPNPHAFYSSAGTEGSYFGNHKKNSRYFKTSYTFTK